MKIQSAFGIAATVLLLFCGNEAITTTSEAVTAKFPDRIVDHVPIATPIDMTYPLHPSRAATLGAHVTYRHRAQVVIHGDSFDALDGLNLFDGGDFAPTPVGWPLIFAPLIGTDVHVEDVARGSKTWVWLMTDALTSVDPKFDPSLLANIVVVEGGTNDLIGQGYDLDAGPAQLDPVVDREWAYCDARHAAHPWFVIAIGPTPTNWANPAGYRHWAQRFRDECSAHADQCIDMAAMPDVGAWGGGTVDTTWSPDNSHPTPNRDARTAMAVLDAVEVILKSRGF